MTVTTIPAPSAPPAAQASHQRPFTTTQTAEASQFQSTRGSGSKEGPSYVLTLHTSDSLHTSMTHLRNVYFPPKLNRLDAHITLFHNLPGEKLETDVIPAIKDIVSGTESYRIQAKNPFRLKLGVGIAVADDVDYADKGSHGRNMTRQIHAALRKRWGDWLSDQDSQPVRMHYTVMNKVDDDQTVVKALEQLKESFNKGVDVSGGRFNHDKPSDSDQAGNSADKDKCEELVTEGMVQGVTLWKYNTRSGRWTEPQQFDFPR